MHGHGRAVDVQLAHQAGGLAHELLAVGVPLGALSQAQQRDEDVLLRVLVGQEGLPAAVGGVVAAHELDLVRADFVLDLVDADLARPHVAARGAEIVHAGQGQLAQVAVLDARRDERHGNVALDAVDARPRRHKSEDARDQVDEPIGRVVLVAPGAPQLVQARAADDERRVDLEPVGAEGGVLEVLAELVQVALHADVGQVWHHVADHLEAGVLGEAEGLGHGGDGVAAVRVSRHVLVQRLHANLEARAAVAEHAATGAAAGSSPGASRS